MVKKNQFYFIVIFFLIFYNLLAIQTQPINSRFKTTETQKI
jgi:hypothetical protein